jgi:hypothetical protein
MFFHAQNIDKICDELKKAFERQTNINENLKKKLTEISDEKWKDKELKSLEEKARNAQDDLYRGFGISKEEDEKIHNWIDRHWAEQHNAFNSTDKLKKGGAIGGTFSYEFLPTSIGTVGICRCNGCQKLAFVRCGGDYQKYQDLIKQYDAEFIFQNI